MVDIQALDAIIAQLSARPKRWNQKGWWSGSSGCIAGWAVHNSTSFYIDDMLMPRRADDDSRTHWERAGREILGLSLAQADALFGFDNTWPDVLYVRDRLAEGAWTDSDYESFYDATPARKAAMRRSTATRAGLSRPAAAG
ncbi:hypothetical protein [Rhodococcus sp. HNM0569]|uniref:hypothetical protein n=1 Tax=Rhodococcus sp. HNM0569 TaxID=2716340 RepID=UPI00146ADDB8|nr:hypothetical protein [Rhodococcus sp. HNM0569]NLU82785.1 hypothetical protein [Rhodococcus sp. HNM0569]